MLVSFSGRIHLSPGWIFGPPESSSVAASVPETTQPQDFDPIFSQGVVIVGGHAVNLWASFYADHGDPLLTRFAPFTSKDADIFANDRDLAVAIATAASTRALLSSRVTCRSRRWLRASWLHGVSSRV